MPPQPNILLITSDEHRWDALGAYGLTPVRTPNLDRLAHDGVLFGRAYCSNPLCSPSRLSMIASLYPSQHGVYTLGVRPDDDYPDAIGHALSRAGYRTGLIGKAHFRPCAGAESIESAPAVFDLDRYRNWHGPYYGFDHVELCIGHSHQDTAAGMHYGAWLEDRGVDRSQYWGRPDQGYCDIGRWDLPEEHHNSRWVAGRWKLVVYHRQPYGELYDLEADPDQYTNLWDDSDHRDVKLDLMRRLADAEIEKEPPRRAREGFA